MNPKLAELISMNDGELPSFITEDFYPIYYLTRKGEILCPTCANLVLKGKAKGQIIADDLQDYKINWDDYDLVCEHGHKIESATVELSTLEESNRNDTSKRKIPIKSRWTKFHSNGK